MKSERWRQLLRERGLQRQREDALRRRLDEAAKHPDVSLEPDRPEVIGAGRQRYFEARRRKGWLDGHGR